VQPKQKLLINIGVRLALRAPCIERNAVEILQVGLVLRQRCLVEQLFEVVHLVFREANVKCLRNYTGTLVKDNERLGTLFCEQSAL
jgi:hypothetical protein